MGKLSAYSSFPLVYHLLNSGEWMESYEQWMKSYEQEKNVKKQSEVQVHAPRSSGSSRGAFSKNLFRDRGRTNDPAVFRITWKRLGIGENHQHEKFRIFRSFSTVYYLPHSDKVCRNYGENMFFAIFETDLKP